MKADTLQILHPMLISQADLLWKLEQDLTPIIYKVAPHMDALKTADKRNGKQFRSPESKGLSELTQ